MLCFVIINSALLNLLRVWSFKKLDMEKKKKNIPNGVHASSCVLRWISFSSTFQLRLTFFLLKVNSTYLLTPCFVRDLFASVKLSVLHGFSLMGTSSLSNVSGSLGERMHELVRAFSSRTQRCKERISQPPTPSSTSSYDAKSGG